MLCFSHIQQSKWNMVQEGICNTRLPENVKRQTAVCAYSSVGGMNMISIYLWVCTPGDTFWDLESITDSH